MAHRVNHGANYSLGRESSSRRHFAMDYHLPSMLDYRELIGPLFTSERLRVGKVSFDGAIFFVNDTGKMSSSRVRHARTDCHRQTSRTGSALEAGKFVNDAD